MKLDIGFGTQGGVTMAACKLFRSIGYILRMDKISSEVLNRAANEFAWGRAWGQ